MADKLVRNRDDNSVIERYVDMGDGTWARKTSGGGGSIPQATRTTRGGVKTDRAYPDGTLAIGPIVANSGIVILGHSYAYYQGMGADSSSTVGGTSSRSYVEWCNSRLRTGGMLGFDVLANLGVGGKTLEEIISTQLPTALTTPGDGAWLMAGVNNLNSTLSNPDTLQEIIAQFKIIIDALSAAKKYVLVDNFAPVTGGGAAPRSPFFPMLNAALKTLCATYTNVFLMDHYTPLIDTTSAHLAALAVTLQTDNVHPTSYGANILGFSDAAYIADKLALTPYYTNIGANMLSTFSGTAGTFLNTSLGGTLVGTVPTGWTLEIVTGTATLTTQLAGTIGPGTFQVSIGTVSGATATVRFYPSAGAALALNFTKATDTLMAEMAITQQQVTGLCRFNFSVEVDNYTQNVMARASDETGYFFSTRNLAGKFRTRPLALTVPATMTSVLPVGYMQVAVSGFCKFYFSEPALFKVA